MKAAQVSQNGKLYLSIWEALDIPGRPKTQAGEKGGVGRRRGNTDDLLSPNYQKEKEKDALIME